MAKRKKRIITGFDPASKDGDHSATITAEVQPDGTIRVIDLAFDKPRQNAPEPILGDSVVQDVDSFTCCDCGRVMPITLSWRDPFAGTLHCSQIEECWALIPEKKEEK